MIALTDHGATLDQEGIELLETAGFEVSHQLTGLELQAWAEQQLAQEDSVLVRAVLQNIIAEVIVATRITAPGTATLQ